MGLLSGILRFLMGLGIGAAVGMALARLLTPRSADEYRQLITERIEAIRSAGDQADAATREAMRAAYEQATRAPGSGPTS